MSTRISAWLFLPLAALLHGCPVWGDSEGGGPSTPSCTVDGDCEVGEACTDGVCVPSSTCVTDGSCGAGEHCDHRGTCVDDVPGGCRDDGDCVSGDVCVEAACVPVGPGTCRFDLECAVGQVCVDSTCTYVCSTNSQCGSGERCGTDGRCVDDPTECLTSADCPSHERCVGGRCLAPCSATSACSDPQDACASDGNCRPDSTPAAFCASDDDCAVGSTCELATGICRVPCDASSELVLGYTPSAGCALATADCACKSSDAQFVSCGMPSGADDYCRTQDELVSDCGTASDCAADESCVNGTCE